MADVRSLLRTERNTRRISHPHATYSTTDTLVCLVCHIQLKSESLWNGHLRSAQHAMRLQRIRDGTLGRPPGAAAPEPQQAEADVEAKAGDQEAAATASGENTGSAAEKNNKRKADNGEEPVRKKSKAGLPDGFFDGPIPENQEAPPPTKKTPPLTGQEIQLPSRPATPLKTAEATAAPKAIIAVDEDEWAAFEADIAAAEAPTAQDAVISAPAISAAELVTKSREEEEALRKERQEAEIEGDREDAVRKLEDEFEEMEALEERVRRLKQKREALRLKNTAGNSVVAPVTSEANAPPSSSVEVNRKVEEEEDEEEEDDDDDDEEEEEESDDDDDDDDWDGFRLKA